MRPQAAPVENGAERPRGREGARGEAQGVAAPRSPQVGSGTLPARGRPPGPPPRPAPPFPARPRPPRSPGRGGRRRPAPHPRRPLSCMPSLSLPPSLGVAAGRQAEVPQVPLPSLQRPGPGRRLARSTRRRVWLQQASKQAPVNEGPLAGQGRPELDRSLLARRDGNDNPRQSHTHTQRPLGNELSNSAGGRRAAGPGTSDLGHVRVLRIHSRLPLVCY